MPSKRPTPCTPTIVSRLSSSSMNGRRTPLTLTGVPPLEGDARASPGSPASRSARGSRDRAGSPAPRAAPGAARGRRSRRSAPGQRDSASAAASGSISDAGQTKLARAGSAASAPVPRARAMQAGVLVPAPPCASERRRSPCRATSTSDFGDRRQPQRARQRHAALLRAARLQRRQQELARRARRGRRSRARGPRRLERALAHAVEILALAEVERQRHHLVAFDLDEVPRTRRALPPASPRTRTRPASCQPLTACLPGLTQASNRAATASAWRRVAGDHEDGVVAADGAGDSGSRGPVDVDGEVLRAGPESVRSTIRCLRSLRRQRRNSRGGPAQGAVERVAAGRGSAPGPGSRRRRPLHQPDFLDIARQRGLRDVDAPLEEALAQRLLVGDLLSPDELEDGGLPLGFHADYGITIHGQHAWRIARIADKPAKSATFLLTSANRPMYKDSSLCIDMSAEAASNSGCGRLWTDEPGQSGHEHERTTIASPSWAPPATPARNWSGCSPATRASASRPRSARPRWSRPARCRPWRGSGTARSCPTLRSHRAVGGRRLPGAARGERRPRLAPALLARGVRVIDLSGAFRLRDDAAARRSAIRRPATLPAGAVYGLTELDRDGARVRRRLIVEPGLLSRRRRCSALLPLQRAGLLDRATSSSTPSRASRAPARRRPSARTSPRTTAASRPTACSATATRRRWNRRSARPVTFVPHLVPLDRGILETIYVRRDAGHDRAARSPSASTPPTRTRRSCALTGDALPEIKHVAYTNFCDIGWKVDEATGRLIVVSVPRQPGQGRRRPGDAELQRAVRLRRTDGPAVMRGRVRCSSSAASCSRRRQRLDAVLAAIAALAGRGPLVVVHGGGREIDAELGAARHRRSRQVDGLRITDAATLDVVVAVLAGTVNTRLVAALGRRRRPRRRPDRRRCAASAGRRCAPPHRAADGELGRSRLVGEPESSADPALMADLRRRRLRAGDRLPRRRRSAASSSTSTPTRWPRRLAAGLGARRLVIAGGTAGVLDEQGADDPAARRSSGIDALDRRRHGHAGMVAKLRACRAALEARRARASRSSTGAIRSGLRRGRAARASRWRRSMASDERYETHDHERRSRRSKRSTCCRPTRR